MFRKSIRGGLVGERQCLRTISHIFFSTLFALWDISWSQSGVQFLLTPQLDVSLLLICLLPVGEIKFVLM
jgi:hypothetical protein